MEAAARTLASVPGRAGGQLDDLIAAAERLGARVLGPLARAALTRLVQRTGGELGVLQAPTLFDLHERAALADALAAALGTAHLLGRAQVRQRRADVLQRHGLAEAVLAVPARRQETPYSCGAAALASVLAYFGATVPEAELVAELATTPADGTSPAALVRVAQTHGLEADGRAGLTVFDLAAALDAGLPVLCPIQAYGTDAEARQLQTGHWVAVIGYDDDQLYLQDPVAGLVQVSPADFERSWTDQDAAGQVYDHYGIVLGPDQRGTRNAERGTEIGEAAASSSALRAPRAALQEMAPLPPERALAYFSNLVPTLGTDPQRFGDDLRRRAFHLAVATDTELLGKVQDLIRDRLQAGQGFGAAPAAIQQLLEDAGVAPSNPQYAEAVFRTNTHDAYHQGATEALQDPDTISTFPVWQYANPHDSRSRPSHAARNGNYYPSTVPFVQVRGTEAKDAINCRCDQIPIDKWTWDERRGAGARIADGYTDVPAATTPPTKPTPPIPPSPAPIPTTVSHAVSPAFVQQLDPATQSLPAKVHRILAEAGYQIVLQRTPTEGRPRLDSLHPPGYSAGLTYAHAPGFQDGFAIVVPETYLDMTSGHYVANTNASGVLRHEAGHALNVVLGQFSDKPAFLQAYAADLAHQRQQNLPMEPYFTGGDEGETEENERGRRETFAEVFAWLHGGGSAPWLTGFLAAWPNTVKLIQERLKSIPAF